MVTSANLANAIVKLVECGGSKAIKHVGLPVISADLARERKAAGWRKV